VMLFYPTEPRVHLFGAEGDQAYSGVWRPGDPTDVPMNHELPFVPTMLTHAGDAAVAIDFEDLRSKKPGCVMLTLPPDGRSTCLTTAQASMAGQFSLSNGDLLTVLESGAAHLERGGTPRPLAPGVTCPDLVIDAVLADPPRAALRCPAENTLAIWSPETIWRGALPEGYPEKAPSASSVISLGDALKPRTRWLSLEAGAVITTPALRAPPYFGLTESRFAAWTDAGGLYWVDTLAQTVTHVGDVDCPGRLSHAVRAAGRGVECSAKGTNLLVSSHLVGPDGWWSTTHRIEHLKGDRVLLSDRTGFGGMAESTSLWVASIE